MLVHHHGSTFGEVDTDFFETQAAGIRETSHGTQNLIDLDRVAMICGRRQPAATAFDFLDEGIEMQCDAAFPHLLGKSVADVVVESAQEEGPPVNQGDVRSHPVQNPRKLDRNVAAAGDDDSLRLAIEVEDLVGRDAEVLTRDL